MSRGKLSTAIDAAIDIVNRDPLGRASASTLGDAMWSAGQFEEGGRAYQLAVSNGWRDRSAQTWAIEAALANKHLGQAAMHVDALLRVAPATEIPAEWMLEIESNPKGRAVMAARLSRSPPWAAQWLRSLAEASASKVHKRIETVRLARAAGMRIERQVARNVTWQMLQKHPGEAYNLWQAINQPEDHLGGEIWGSNLMRGALLNSGGPFEWRKTDTTGVQMIGGRRGRVPVLEIRGLTLSSAELAQTHLALLPGTYRLLWNKSDPALLVDFRISCIGPDVNISAKNVSRSRSTSQLLQFKISRGCILQKVGLTANGNVSGLSEGFISALRLENENNSTISSDVRRVVR
ncbi:hypothetical protein [Roseibium sp.]|uniref:hypothetical protein n=1 Tax=Roseibium sp. TaxID=1936156 RepID=UPI003297E58C